MDDGVAGMIAPSIARDRYFVGGARATREIPQRQRAGMRRCYALSPAEAHTGHALAPGRRTALESEHCRVKSLPLTARYAAVDRVTIGACCDRLGSREDAVLRRSKPRQFPIDAFLCSLVAVSATHEHKKTRTRCAREKT
jgi:hypothetical protein